MMPRTLIQQICLLTPVPAHTLCSLQQSLAKVQAGHHNNTDKRQHKWLMRTPQLVTPRTDK
uniref:Uncharacterized protein n=1 Tax=Setaria italica TaxID=4555 RepID=K3ZBN2_SETIT